MDVTKKNLGPLKYAAAATRSPLRQVGLPVAILIVVTVVDLATGPGTVFYPFLLLAPTLAAATAPPLAILGIGCASLPLRYMLAKSDGYLAPAYDDLFTVSTWMYVLATGLSMYLSSARIRHERDLVALSQVAVAAQRAILLPPPEELGGVRIAVRYFAVADQAELGGDLYLGLDTPYGMRMIVGDVLGKGLGAVRTAAITLGAFREAAYDEPELDTVAHRIEVSLARNAPEDQFVTALLVEVRPEHVVLVHRGHEQPVVIRADGTVQVLEPPEPGVPLGLGELDPHEQRAWKVPFGEGDLLLLMTDGVSDARDVLGGSYPLVERITELLGGRQDGARALAGGGASMSAGVRAGAGAEAADQGRGTEADPLSAVERLGDDLQRHVGPIPFTDDALLLALVRSSAENPAHPPSAGGQAGGPDPR
ncbi:PP2C family protein-serine/threonine phosphatase [Yinghuangia soli]|uniref:Serine/threonine-protein phosphatase n=1 Tax=Yinghuangia soli TaxID=2908204 RepID=A0AA41U179_9ACTN|nr:PP2C family protein-serine/threonine phosphatase [Yinghuangia soli]MCF2525854.1 serine/threonine-protein phosphatase [Yinghuangia soli]